LRFDEILDLTKLRNQASIPEGYTDTLHPEEFTFGGLLAGFGDLEAFLGHVRKSRFHNLRA